MQKYQVLVLSLVSLGAFAQQAKPSPEQALAQAPIATAELKTPAMPDTSGGRVAPASALPVGTAIRMKLETPLYTGSTKAGDTFSGRVLEDVKLNNKIVLPVGATLQGHVVQVTEPRRIKGKPTIQLRPEFVTLPNGHKYAVSAAVVDTNNINGTNVDDEGRIKGPGHGDHDVMEVGAGAGGGAIIGALAGGAKGSLIGAGIGVVGTTVHWLTKHNYAYLPAGSEIIFELSHPMEVSATETQGN
jgi:hypothetical protein